MDARGGFGGGIVGRATGRGDGPGARERHGGIGPSQKVTQRPYPIEAVCRPRVDTLSIRRGGGGSDTATKITANDSDSRSHLLPSHLL